MFVYSQLNPTGSLGGSSAPPSGKENERNALVKEAATQAAQLIQQSDGDEALAKRSEVRNPRSPGFPRFNRRNPRKNLGFW